MAVKTLIIHGWSDCSKSFKALKECLARNGAGDVDTIFYADYESREDNITFNDVVDGLNDEMKKHKFIDSNGKKLVDLNVIVHSTGGLVIRHWIWAYYFRDGNRIEDCPVKNLVMLAPANFGSPLAHRGKSFLGSLFKGRWKIGDLLEVGHHLLHGLELASPYQWELAHHDIFNGSPYYNAKQIRTTVLVGIKDYSGLRGWVNKPGTDGTVVISGTQLESSKLKLDFSRPADEGKAYEPYTWEMTGTSVENAFGILDGMDHGSIVDQAGDDNSQVNRLILEAFNIGNEDEFLQFKDELKEITSRVYEDYQALDDPDDRKYPYQQYFIHAVDDQGAPVSDFTIEFFVFKASKKAGSNFVRRVRVSRDEEKWSKKINKALTSQFHQHSKDSSYRRILVDTEKVVDLMEKAGRKMRTLVILAMRIYVPKIDKGIMYNTKNLQTVVLFDPGNIDANLPSFLYPNTTTLIELKVDRYNTYVSIGKKPKKH